MTDRLFRPMILAALFVSTVSYAASDAPIASSGKARVHLVELYSSESCSSCPPADAWVSTLQNKPELWKNFVPVVFHVDYWNQLGWKDGFSSDKMTKRQVNISNLWVQPSVYTPAFVVDGQEWQDWRSPGSSFPSSTAQGIELSVFKNTDGSFRVKASGLNPSKHYFIRAAALGMNLSTDVKGGENSGRLLKHNFVVLDWDGKSLSAKTPEQSFTFKVANQKTPRLAIAAWIEEEGNPTPLQSVGGYL
jgi:hypothetical protein